MRSAWSLCMGTAWNLVVPQIVNVRAIVPPARVPLSRADPTGPSAAAETGGCKRAVDGRRPGANCSGGTLLQATLAIRFIVNKRLIRVLTLLMAIVLPLRVAAAGVVPILGTPGHAHQHHQESGTLEHAAAAAARVPPSANAAVGAHEHLRACVAHAAQADALDGGLLESGCPHLGMAIVSAPVLPLAGERKQWRSCRACATRYVSVILDVPSPPPTARA